MLLKDYLTTYSEFMIGHLKDGCSRKKDPIVLPLQILQAIEICFSRIRELNQYIYENHFHECLEYLEIKSDLVKELMLDQYPKVSFLDHNIISRLDVFFTKK